MDKIGENPHDWYDEEEHYIDDLHAFLTDYHKKIWNSPSKRIFDDRIFLNFFISIHS